MDILLGLGMVGLALVLLLLIQAVYRAGSWFVADSQAENLLPLLIIVYFSLSNVSISYFLGIESFHWVLFVSAVFIVTPVGNYKTQDSRQPI
jgi:hypothetical protein